MPDIMSDSRLLRKSMQFNAVFSLLSALTCLFFSEGVAVFIGLGADAGPEIIGLGISLLIFAGFLFAASSERSAGKQQFLVRAGAIIIVLDILWVVSSAYVLLRALMPLNLVGQWTVAIIALLVLDFAILQSLGLRRVGLANSPATQQT